LVACLPLTAALLRGPAATPMANRRIVVAGFMLLKW